MHDSQGHTATPGGEDGTGNVAWQRAQALMQAEIAREAAERRN